MLVKEKNNDKAGVTNFSAHFVYTGAHFVKAVYVGAHFVYTGVHFVYTGVQKLYKFIKKALIITSEIIQYAILQRQNFHILKINNKARKQI